MGNGWSQLPAEVGVSASYGRATRRPFAVEGLRVWTPLPLAPLYAPAGPISVHYTVTALDDCRRVGDATAVRMLYWPDLDCA